MAFLVGVAAAATLGVTLFYLLGGGFSEEGDGDKNWLDWLIIGLLVLLAIRIVMKQNEAEPPRWMGKLEQARPRFALAIGFLLYSVMPTDAIAMATVAAYLVRQGSPGGTASDSSA